MAYERKTIYVYENWSGKDPRPVGILYAEQIRGTEHFSFEYTDDYLKGSRRNGVRYRRRNDRRRRYGNRKGQYGSAR